MSLYKKRERFNRLSIKVGLVFSRLGLSPNQWTLLTLLPALAAFYFILQQNFVAAFIFFAAAAFFDLIDGSVARVTGKVTKKGAYLDTIIDRYVEFIIILGLFLVPLPGFYMPATFWLFLYLFGGMMTTYAKAAAKEKELIEGKELKGGLLERAERLMILFVGILVAYFSLLWLTIILAILAVLTNVTAIQRIAKAVSLKDSSI
jgi:phosphatidylglycerophosphate synthase